MPSSLPSIDGIIAGAKFNQCVGLQAGTIAASFLQALGVDAPDVADAYPSLFEWACDIPPADAPAPPAPPFVGGQCPVPYTACLRLESDQGRAPANGFTCVNATGPFSVVQEVVFGNTWRVRLIAGNGSIAVQLSLPSAHTNRRFFCQFTRPGGLPDNCGNPPVQPPIAPYPPTGLPVTGPITYRDEGDNVVTVEGDFIFQAPTVNIRGEVEVNFTVDIDVDNRQYKGTLNLTTGGGQVNPVFIPPGRGVGEPDEPIETPAPPNTDEPATDDPETELIRAVVVIFDVQGNRRATELLYQNQPLTFAPRLGVVRFAIAVPGTTQAVWTGDIPIKQTRQWVDCPSPYGAVDVVASPDPGSGNVVLQVVPIRGPCPCD